MQSFAKYDCALLQDTRPEHFRGRIWAPDPNPVFSVGFTVTVRAFVSVSLQENRQLI